MAEKPDGPDPEALTEYERRRLENIHRNQAILAELRRDAADVSAAYALSRTKRGRPRAAPAGPAATGAPRRSGRARRQPLLPASSAPLPSAHLKRRTGRFHISEAFVGEAAVTASYPSARLTSTILAASWPSDGKVRTDGLNPYQELVLKPGNVKMLAPSVIGATRMLPLADRRVVVVGTSFGNLVFWDATRQVPEWQPPCSRADEVFWYHPHTAAVTGITAHPSAPMKIYSCNQNGEICLMDVEKENFNMIHLCDDSVFSLCQSPDNSTSLYFGEGNGDIKVFDERRGKISGVWKLHRDCISSIDVNPENAYMLATSSLDSTACIWDLRNMKMLKPESLKVVEHKMHVHSAYFSPSGSILATTSWDNTIGILSVHDFENSYFLHHGCPSTTFKASWGWNGNELFVGTEWGIDVVSIDINDSSISTSCKARMESAHMAQVPSQFYAHPYQVGCLACVGHRNKLFLWTPKLETGQKDFL